MPLAAGSPRSPEWSFLPAGGHWPGLAPALLPETTLVMHRLRRRRVLGGGWWAPFLLERAIVPHQKPALVLLGVANTVRPPHRHDDAIVHSLLDGRVLDVVVLQAHVQRQLSTRGGLRVKRGKGIILFQGARQVVESVTGDGAVAEVQLERCGVLANPGKPAGQEGDSRVVECGDPKGPEALHVHTAISQGSEDALELLARKHVLGNVKVLEDQRLARHLLFVDLRLQLIAELLC
mmetsp:Transcript_15580/g.49270  ORF Transcript_15580/g.49270 Transcript_15580/m.49270 type:complete len:235 (+) Transcript_15580:660-1364(+)